MKIGFFSLVLESPILGSEVPPEQVLSQIEDSAIYWQYGWTTVFLGSVALQTHTLTQRGARADDQFDARVSLVTSGSGLLSTLINPLPAAFLGDYRQLPESTPQEKLLKQREAERVVLATAREIERRRSLAFHVFTLTEQILAAGAIAWIDGRPNDATRRLLLGTLSSGLFIYTTPRLPPDSIAGFNQVSWHIIPEGLAVQLRF